MGKLFAPDGTEIVGTFDRVPGTALTIGFTRHPDGTIEADYEGTTEMDWDGQKTATRNGQPLMVDEDGDIWPLNECKFVEETEEVA